MRVCSVQSEFHPSNLYTLSCHPMLGVGLNGPPVSNGAHPILLGQTSLKDVDKNTTPLLTLRRHRLDKRLVE